jgi:hypothetical protein
MDSQGHRANILNDKFSEIGIAIASGKYNGRDSIYVVQLFGQPVSQKTVQERVIVRGESPSVPNLEQETNVSGVVASAVASPKMILKFVYLTLGSIVLLSFILFVSIKPRRLHTKNIVYMLLLLVFITGLFYLSYIRLFPQILVE